MRGVHHALVRGPTKSKLEWLRSRHPKELNVTKIKFQEWETTQPKVVKARLKQHSWWIWCLHLAIYKHHLNAPEVPV